MPSSFPRIGVVRDHELDRALRQAEQQLGKRPAATLVRALALRGARALAEEPPPDEPTRWLVEELGATAATARLEDVLPDLGPPDPANLTAASDALEEQRAERLP